MIRLRWIDDFLKNLFDNDLKCIMNSRNMNKKKQVQND